jgi:hypothetical protein
MAGKNCIKNPVHNLNYQIKGGLSNLKGRYDQTCGTYEGKENPIHGFGGGTTNAAEHPKGGCRAAAPQNGNLKNTGF